MGRKRSREHVRGPYKGRRGGWRLQYCFEDGTYKDLPYPTREAAERDKAELNAALRVEALSVAEVLDLYAVHLHEQGNQEGSVYQTITAIRRFLPDPLVGIASVGQLAMEGRYRELRKKYAVATHRNSLSQAKTFGAWLVTGRYLDENPWEGIRGKGKRERGKPQLRRVEARRWLQAALGVAIWGVEAVCLLVHPEPYVEQQIRRNDTWAPASDRAVAALCALFLGFRCTEIVRLRVRDLDATEEFGDTIVLDRSKTRAGERTIEVPAVLRPFLIQRARGKLPGAWLFPATRSETGRHDRNWPRHQVQWICELAGVPRVCAHAMRGMVATFAFRAGAVGELVARYLGHESVTTTLESYALPGAGDDATRTRGLQVLQGGRDAADKDE